MNLKIYRSDYCTALERVMECYNTLDECYTSENLKKFKAASLELSVQFIGTVSDETEDMFQGCPIYTELVGIRKSTKMMWEGIFIGVIIVIAFIASFILYKNDYKCNIRCNNRSKHPSYNQAATSA